MKNLNVLIFVLFVSCSHLGQMGRDPSSVVENYEGLKYREQCEFNQTIFREKDSKSKVFCHKNYHHYNANFWERREGSRSKPKSKRYSRDRAIKKEKIRIASFNVWHPGKSNTRFKDYEIIARIIDKSDIVAAQELLPVLSADEQNNDFISRHLKEQRAEYDGITHGSQTRDLIGWRNIIRGRIAKSRGERRRFLQEKYDQIDAEIQEYVRAYRKPGYLKILDELQKRDRSWALIIQSQGEAAKSSDVHELSGFYYRARVVRPKINRYCSEMAKGKSGNLYGCTPDLPRSVFSRRPFMASFESGKFDFTMLTSHVVFNSPSPTSPRGKTILSEGLGVRKLDELDLQGARSLYARFAETYQMKKFVEELEQNDPEKNIILAGDFNLELSHNFFESPYMTEGTFRAYIDAPTTVTDRKYVDGQETNGLASNYDHFFLNPNETEQCDLNSMKADNFIRTQKRSTAKYILREEQPIADVIHQLKYSPYEVEDMIRQASERIQSKMDSQYKVSARGDVEPRFVQEERDRELFDFRERIFGLQFNNHSYYRVYRELMSDHIPVQMDCYTNMPDRD